jgi:hypothetical protein
MNNNHYNLNSTKLGMAKYLASVELSMRSNANPYSHYSQQIYSNYLIPPEGDINTPTPELETNFMTKQNYQFGESQDMNDALSWSTLDNNSQKNSRKGSLITPQGPVKNNKVPRKTSTSSISTQESHVINRNRLGSIEEQIHFKNFFVSPTKDIKERERKKSQEIDNFRQDLEKKYSKIIYVVSRKIPMCEDSFVYSLLLFKKVIAKVDSIKYATSQIEFTYEDH